MRRTIHFYVMVTSLYLLLLKGARSDYIENNQLINTAQECQNCSLGMTSASCLLTLADGNKVYDGYTNELNLSVKIAYLFHIISPDFDTIASDDMGTITEASVGKSLWDKMESRSPDYTEQDVMSSYRYSSSRNQPPRISIQSLAVRRIDYRHDTFNKRKDSSHQREINLRREIRADNTRMDGRRRVEGIRSQSMTRCTTLESRRLDVRVNLYRESHDRRQTHSLDRRNIENQRNDGKRQSKRNIVSYESRNRRDQFVSARQMRSYERRRRNANSQEMRENRASRASRQEREEKISEFQIRRFTKHSSSRQERRERVDTRTFDMQIRKDNSEEFRPRDQFSSRNNNRNVGNERRHEQIVQREYSKGRFVQREYQGRREGIVQREYQGRREGIVQRAQHGRHEGTVQREQQGRHEGSVQTKLDGRRERIVQREKQGRREGIVQREQQGRHEGIVQREKSAKHAAAGREFERSLNRKSTLNSRRFDEIRVYTKDAKSAKLRYDVQPQIRHENSDGEGRRLYQSKEGRRSEGIHDGRRSRSGERHTIEAKQIRSRNIQGINSRTEAFENVWSLDERGISRAILVGFIGILGRRLWHKQA